MRIKRRKLKRMMMLAAVFIVLIIIIVAVALLLKSLKSLDSITITPNFADTELDVNTDYVFSVKASPSRANIKSLEYEVDDATATFDKGTENEIAILHTGAEGTITVSIKKNKIESNKLTFVVVDQVKKAEEEAAAQAAAQAEAAAAAQAAAEEAARAEEEARANMVMITGDLVRMRAEPNTDCDIVRNCKSGEIYTRIEEVDDWTKVDYNGRECYIKTEFIRICTPEEAEEARAEALAEAETEAAEKKNEEKKKEEKKEEKKPEAETPAAETPAEQPAGDNPGNTEQPAGDAQVVTPVAPVANTVQIVCKDGTGTFSKAEYDYFIATWSYTGMAEEMMSHHSIGELHELYNNTH